MATTSNAKLARRAVLISLKRAWRDGTSRLVFEPREFLAKLVALPVRSTYPFRLVTVDFRPA